MHEALLQQIGLTDDQIILYETLLKTGPIKASKLTQKTPFKRVLIYKLLNDLVNLGLVEKDEESNNVILFKPTHPSALHCLIEKREEQLKNVKTVLASSMPALLSDFNLISGKPGISFFEGIEGLKKIYNNILETGENFLLVRSSYEPVYKNEIVPIIDDFIKKRVAKGMRVNALTPRDQEGRKTTQEEDAKMLYERTWVDPKAYNAPVEIDIYGNKIAILSFGKELIGVIVESPQIAQAMKQLFLMGKRGATAVKAS